jgi:HAMP domain-containing protein
MSDEETSAKYKKKRTRILYLITALIIVVFIAYGLVTWFIFRGSQDRLVEKSKEKLIETEAANINSALGYISDLIVEMLDEQAIVESPEEFLLAIQNREITKEQLLVSQEINEMMKGGLLGLDLLINVLLPDGVFSNEPLVVVASDDDLIYNWEMPDYILEAIEDGKTFLYMEDGIPGLNLTGEQLITIRVSKALTLDIAVLAVKSMQDKVAAIDSFFGDEQRSINLVLGLVILCSIIFIILISFFVLSYMIRKRITEPVDELAAAAEQVNQGNLDVEVSVHEGGDFEGLERAFKEMVESWRRYIDKSVGEE